MRLNEFGNEKLSQYKTAAAADAKKADAAGDFARGHKRFKGINAATKKQFANDAKLSQLKEFAPGSGGGDAGNYFRELASAWYNGAYDSGSLQKGIKSKEDVERLLQRGVVAPDGVTRKFGIDYNAEFDGVVISSDDYYEHSDNGKKPGTMIDTRTGQAWGPYDYMEFSDDDLSESVNPGMAEDDDAVAAFLARGGEIQQLKPQRGPKRSGVGFASKHIGSGSGRGTTKGQVSGLGANTGKAGKPVVTAEQGVAEGSEQKPAITYKDYTLQYDYQTEDDDPEGYSTATTYYFDVLKDGDRVGEAEYFDYFGNLTIRINGKTKEFEFRHPLASQISQLVSSLPDDQKKDLSDPRFESQGVAEGWSQKYKKSINCSHPKGFSQKAHCAGKQKHNESIEMEMVCEDCGMCQSHGSLNEIAKGAKDANGVTKCWPGKHAEGTKTGKNGGQVRNCVPNESVAEDSLAAMRRLAGVTTPAPAAVPNGLRQYRHMPTAVQPR